MAEQSNDSANPIEPSARRPRVSRTGKILAAMAATSVAAALCNTYLARQVERRHPPSGQFVTLDRVRLHYIAKGEGPPVVLVHGNVVTAEDFVLSGVLERLAEHHRVLAFDRPGFGYSERPRGRLWTPAEQAELLHQAFARLGIERPVVLGHSIGALVALALALDHPDAVSGLVLLSGYYYPTLRGDVPVFAAPAIPIIGDVMCYTVSPPFGLALMPLVIKGMFAPRPVPERFSQRFPYGMSVRPWQIRAEAQDAAVLRRGARTTAARYSALKMPVAILAGAEDLAVDVGAHAERLHHDVPQSTLRVISNIGHVIHYDALDQVVQAVAEVEAAQRNLTVQASNGDEGAPL